MNRDLVVLAPCKAIEQAIAVLLVERYQSIGIRPITIAQIVVHPNRDPGVYNTGHELLQPFADDTEHALIVFDRAWDGAPSTDAAVLARAVEGRCARDWCDRVRCVCIEPEIENWVWSDSPHVPTILGWSNHAELLQWLRERGLWPSGAAKPPDPRKAFEDATHKTRVNRSSSIFGELARKVGISHCRDPSFLHLLEILRGWFPATRASG